MESFFPPANDETTMEKWTVRRATMKITDRGNGMKLQGLKLQGDATKLEDPEKKRETKTVEVDEACRNEEKFHLDGILGTRTTLPMTIVLVQRKFPAFWNGRVIHTRNLLVR